MKNVLKGVLVALIAVGLVVGMASCGGSNPKALAKQNLDTSIESLKLMKTGVAWDDPKMDKLKKKAEAIQAKVDALSDAEKEIYQAEATRLVEAVDWDLYK